MTLKDINKYFLGFDEAQSRIQQLHEQMAAKTNHAYPPYNLRKTSDHKYLIELAVAGYKQDELDIEIENGQLTINARKREHDTDKAYSEWIHQGIAYRGFTRSFYTDNRYEVLAAELEHGLLKIYFGLREDKRPKKVSIGYRNQQQQLEF